MIASGYEILVKQTANKRRTLEGLCHIFPKSAPKPSTLTEISGTPGSGRSELLVRLIARTILPDAYKGKSSQVIFLDLNHKIDEIEKYIREIIDACGSIEHIEATTVTTNCLNSIIRMACYSSEQLDIAFDEQLEDLLWDNENISLLAIDGLDSFYWEDCYGRLQRMSTHYKRLCQRLKSICQQHNICCIYTVDAYYLQSKPNAKVSTHSSFNSSLIDYRFKLTQKEDSIYINGTHLVLDEI
ncbi:X-ray repair cross complementing 2 [Haematobia irritans]|uniref:X-ray repair cross complementing 2 n=1 Tax=Haematobia irritans TaxID=7368 RepID=UPI003F504C08